MRFFSKPALQGAVVGALVGDLLLHPVSMLIIAHTMPGSMASMHIHQDVISILMETLMANHVVMSLYFALLGSCMGMMGGYLRGILQEKNIELEHSNTLLVNTLGERESLLRILTHDLVNYIGSPLEMLKGLQPDRPGSHPILTIAPEKVYRLVSNSLFKATQLLQFTRTLIAIESGKLKITLSRHDVLPLIQDAIALFHSRAKEKQLEFQCQLPEKPVVLMIEPIAFANSIMNNLLSNAVKFSRPEGTIDIQIVLDSPAPNFCQLKVISVGPGISPERAEHLFSSTGITSTQGTGGEKGTGFGLPLVKKFTEHMNGTIEVKSLLLSPSPDIAQNQFILAFPLDS